MVNCFSEYFRIFVENLSQSVSLGLHLTASHGVCVCVCLFYVLYYYPLKDEGRLLACMES